MDVVPVPAEIVEGDNEQQQPEASALNADDYYAGCYLDDDENVDENYVADEDEFAAWLSRGKHKDNRKVADPIAYWISKLNEFPRVARMALNLMSAPAMSTCKPRGTNQRRTWRPAHLYIRAYAHLHNIHT